METKYTPQQAHELLRELESVTQKAHECLFRANSAVDLYQDQEKLDAELKRAKEKFWYAKKSYDSFDKNPEDDIVKITQRYLFARQEFEFLEQVKNQREQIIAENVGIYNNSKNRILKIRSELNKIYKNGDEELLQNIFTSSEFGYANERAESAGKVLLAMENRALQKNELMDLLLELQCD